MIDYKKVLSKSISESKKEIKKIKDPDYRKLLEVERKNKNRKGIKKFLNGKIDKSKKKTKKSKKKRKTKSKSTKKKKNKEKKPKIKMVDNLELHGNKVIVSVNPYFYDMDVIYSSLYNFLDECYCKVDGEPKEEILVELKPKSKKKNPELFGRKFNNELINYTAREIRGLKTEGMRLEIVKRALASHRTEEKPQVPEKLMEDWEKDPEGINIPWEEKFGEGE